MNITLIGMPAVGKSFIGKKLAKIMNYEFIDGDDLIVASENKPLQKIIDLQGEDKFLEIEKKVILSLKEKKLQNTVISPGGSLVYISDVMKFLKGISKIIYLEGDFKEIEKRMHNRDSRGIVGLKNKTLKQLYDERTILYRNYADIIIKVPAKINREKSANEIIENLNLQLAG